MSLSDRLGQVTTLRNALSHFSKPDPRRSDRLARPPRCALGDYHATNLAHARRASEELARAGFNLGTVPYGYRAARVRVATGTRRPRWLTRLVLEPVEAAAVKMIFLWRIAEKLSFAMIQHRLAAERHPAPIDPATGHEGVWTETAAHAIFHNPKYTGRQLWGRRHRGSPVSPERGLWSSAWAHPPLLTDDQFATANAVRWLGQHAERGQQQ
jgi:hypothetical protein